MTDRHLNLAPAAARMTAQIRYRTVAIVYVAREADGSGPRTERITRVTDVVYPVGPFIIFIRHNDDGSVTEYHINDREVRSFAVSYES